MTTSPPRTRRLLRRLVDIDLLALIAVLAAALGLWGFLEVVDEVVEGEARVVDERILLAFREPGDPDDPLGPIWLEGMVRDVTSLGGIAVLVLATAIVAGMLVLQRRRRSLLLLLAATSGAGLLSLLLKTWYARPRPELVAHLMPEHSPSFPSGHALAASAVYLTLGALVARFVAGTASKLYVLAVALLLSVLVGISRLYLGVHYPTDVVAGWCVGLSWAMLCWLAARFLQRRGAVESPPPET